MRFIRFERLARWGTGALILLLLHGVVAPSSAQAACNHLVTSRFDRFLDFKQLDALIVGDLSFLVPDEQARDPLQQPVPKRRLPCSGPSCTDRVPSPVSTATQGSAGSNQWGGAE